MLWPEAIRPSSTASQMSMFPGTTTFTDLLHSKWNGIAQQDPLVYYIDVDGDDDSVLSLASNDEAD